MTMLKRLAAFTLLAFALVAPAASASNDQVSMIMDDDLLVYRGDAVRDQAMVQMKQLGVDYLRVTVLWSVVAENARPTAREIRAIKSKRKRAAARRQARRFRATNPRTYPTRNWDKYDRLVKKARELGLGVYFNVTPPGPPWAMGKAPRGLRGVVQRAWKPNASDFTNFVTAVGKRYSGTFRDENDDRGPLPRVSFWSLLNEPNQAGWIAPQWEGNRMYAPVKARELYLRGRAALDRTGHGRDVILFGETAPLGDTGRGPKEAIHPRRFLSTMLCVQRGTGCGMFEKYGPIRATGFGHHPYTKNRSPLEPDRSPNSFTMANLGALGSFLDDAARRTRNLPANLPIYLTEFGFETNPPDPFSGIPLARQAEWNQLGELLAFINPRVASQTQFLLRDVAPDRTKPRSSKSHWFTLQSGLETVGGTPKPSRTAYAFPFVANAQGGGSVAFWGQLRFRPNALPPGAQDSVQLQFRPQGGSGFQPLGDPILVENAKGYFTGRVQVPGAGELRAAWASAPSIASLPQAVGG